MNWFRNRQRSVKIVLAIIGGAILFWALAVALFWASFFATIWVIDSLER